MWKQHPIYIGFLFLFLGTQLSAQLYKECSTTNTGLGTYSLMGFWNLPGSSTKVIPRSDIEGQTDYEVKSVKALIYLDFGDHYPYGEENFEASVDLDLSIEDYSGSPVGNVTPFQTIDLSDDSPEKVIFMDLPVPSNLSDPFWYDIKLTNPTFDFSVDTDGIFPVSTGNNNFRIRVCYEIEYGVDVRSSSTLHTPFSVDRPQVMGNSKRFTFSWYNGQTRYPEYELQILRLYNTLEDTPQDRTDLHTEVDWSRALSVLVPHTRLDYGGVNDPVSYPLSVGEGTGYYIWRVRPIGSRYEGGFANNKNWGVWSTNGVVPNGQDIDWDNIAAINNLNYAFYFDDPDEERNYSYTRSFTEEGKTHEGVTYADGLLRARQSQSYLPSNDKKNVISQTQYDHVGRQAVGALPVPTDRDLEGYKERFIQDAGGVLYTVDNFDTDTKLENPDEFNQSTNSDFSYYSDNNTSNDYVPDAEGYPFSRTVYSNDGTSFVKEQSGVGERHMLGDQSNGRGRTTRMAYADVAPAELLRVFGDEAPKADKVMKEITTDPNNIQSVRYITQDGQLIATCLSYRPTTENLLDNLSSEGNPINVSAFMNSSSYTEEGFVSTKRIVLSDNTPFTIDYQPLSCGGVNICGQVLDCDFEVEFLVVNVDSPSVNLVPDSLQGLPLPLSTQHICDSLGGDLSFTLNLPAGDYLIKKVMRPVDSGVEDAINGVIDELQTELVVYNDFIASLLDQVDSEADWDSLDIWMNCVEDYVASSITLAQLADCLDNNDCDTSLIDFDTLAAVPLDAITNLSFDLSTGFQMSYDDCGGSESINLDPGIELSICADDSCGGQYTYLGVCYDYPPFIEYFADVTGEALLDLQYDIASLFPGYAIDSNDIRDYLNGTASINANDFNRMVWHMLNDEYYCGQLRWDPSTTTYYKVNADGSLGLAYNATNDNTTQYTCRQLWECWQANVGIIAVAVQAYADGALGSLNYDQEIDNQNDGDGSVHDDHFDENLPWTLKAFLWISGYSSPTDRLRNDTTLIPDFAPEQLQFDNLAYLFLECTGFRLARIIDPGIGPITSISNASTSYGTYLSNQTVHTNTGGSSTFSSTSFNTLDIPLQGDYAQTPPFTVSSEMQEYIDTRNSTVLDSKDLPFAFNPVFAFKYFEYPGSGSFTNPFAGFSGAPDSLSNDPKYIACEVNNCYPIPPDSTSNYCGDLPGCDYGHDEWTCGKRYEFLICLQFSTGVIVPDDASTTLVSQSECDSVYNEWTDTTLVDGYSKNPLERGCQQTCEDRRADFRLAIINALEARCYIVGGCPDTGSTAYVPLEDVEALTQILVDSCQGQCEVTVDSAGMLSCDLLDGTTVYLCDVVNGTDCELYLVEQAQGWNFEVDFISKCGDGDYPDGHLQLEVANNQAECDGATNNFNASPPADRTSSNVKTINATLPQP